MSGNEERDVSSRPSADFLRRPVVQVAVMAVAFWAWTSALRPDETTALTVAPIAGGPAADTTTWVRGAEPVPGRPAESSGDRFAGGVTTGSPGAPSQGAAPTAPGTLPGTRVDGAPQVGLGGAASTTAAAGSRANGLQPNGQPPVDPLPPGALPPGGSTIGVQGTPVTVNDTLLSKTVGLALPIGPDGARLEQLYSIVWVTPPGANAATPALVPIGAPRTVQPSASATTSAADPTGGSDDGTDGAKGKSEDSGNGTSDRPAPDVTTTPDDSPSTKSTSRTRTDGGPTRSTPTVTRADRTPTESVTSTADAHTSTADPHTSTADPHTSSDQGNRTRSATSDAAPVPAPDPRSPARNPAPPQGEAAQGGLLYLLRRLLFPTWH